MTTRHPLGGVTPPLAVDIDGTITDAGRSVDPRVFAVLREWDAPVVVATGKALPFPFALCEFAGIRRNVVAENGGIAYVQAADDLVVAGDDERARAVAEEYRAAGHDLGWGRTDMVNRWRETELVVHRSRPLEPLERIAADHGLEVVDTGFAYHVKTAEVSKGQALSSIAERLGRETEEFVAVGDSVNDASTFEVAGRSFAVGNADAVARAAADVVVEERYAEGFLAVVERIEAGSE